MMIVDPKTAGSVTETIGSSVRRLSAPRRKILVLSCILLAFGIGAAFGKIADRAVYDHLGVSPVALIRSPLAVWRMHQRNWNSFGTVNYARDEQVSTFRQNIETNLLPLAIIGKRLSDAYAVPKLGGAIRVIGNTVIILDRLGGLYRYDLPSGPFAPMRTIPALPNDPQAFLAHRPGPPINLADATNDEFRARDIIYLPDRRELAACYDKFDEAAGKIRTVVSLIPFDAKTLTATGSWHDVFASDEFSYGAGISSGAGMLAYRQGGKLYVSIGDHYIIDPKVSEDPNSTFGKIIEIDLTQARWRVFSKGHRNPEGLTFTKAGELLATEHGPRGGDELNLITAGSDFGWPNVTLGTNYDSYEWPSGTAMVGSHTGYQAPLFAWTPSIAPSQIIEVNHFDPRWDGDLLVATLKASSLYRIRMEQGHVLYTERIWIGDRIRDLAETDDGALVLWTDDTKLIVITVDKDQLNVGRRTPTVVGNTIVDRSCLACHHFGPTNPTDFAPTLSNLLNRPIASDSFSYSPALRAKQKLGPWTPVLLKEFLSDPFKFASGTMMVPFALSQEEINEIVGRLVAASRPTPTTASAK
jgi:cytochrome c2